MSIASYAIEAKAKRRQIKTQSAQKNIPDNYCLTNSWNFLEVTYIQSAYILADEDSIKREYSPLDAVNDNYEKIVVSLDDLKLPSKEGIIHIQTSDLLNHLQ